MKLMTEQNWDVSQRMELDESTGKKAFFIEGIFMQGDIKNRNGRVYPSEVLFKESARYEKEYVQQNRAYGELGHPQGPTINLDRASHRIVELHPDASNVVGKARVMDTPMGNIVKAIMEDGGQLGVSSRGMGSVKQNREGIAEVQKDFMLATAGDIVADPSAPQAFVRGIMEGVEWYYDASTNSFASRVIDDVLKTGHRSAKKLDEAFALRAFERFLNSL